MAAVVAWLVCVDLPAMARRLSKDDTHHRDELDAAIHLTRPHKGEPSPFRQTLDWGLLYTEVDPTLLLEPEDVIYAKVVAPTKHPEKLTAIE